MHIGISAALAGLLAAAAVASAQAANDSPAHVRDYTTQGRQLLKAPRPQYPPEERGRWTESCVAFYFTVRPDGKTDGFVLLEAPRYLQRFEDENQTKIEREDTERRKKRFIKPALEALFGWQYAPAARPTEEIAVFRYERSSVGGQLMNFNAWRLDLGTPQPKACTEVFDPKEVRKIVQKARGG